jgi:hypothetical protein
MFTGVQLYVGLIVIIAGQSLALDPPEKLWERFYSSIDVLQEIEMVSTGGVICAGYSSSGDCIFRFNDNGDPQWSAGGTHPWRAEDVEELSDGCFIATGANWIVSGDHLNGQYTSVLFIQKYSSDGNVLWTKEYSAVDELQQGLGVTELPDGGYAISGQIHGEIGSSVGQAWILRTDSDGDTLWTDVWGTYPVNYARAVEYDPAFDRIVVAAFGASNELPLNCPHLLYYSLDGDYLFGTSYSALTADEVRGFSSAYDGGYTLLSRHGIGTSDGNITHMDASGVLFWTYEVLAQPPDDNDNLGLGFTQIDSGYLCCGWTGYWSPPPDSSLFTEQVFQADTGSTKDGWLMRYGADGTFLWSVENEIGANNYFYSAVQLPEGGYIAAGSSSGGYLVRYAPETGIEGSGPSSGIQFDVSPNPFSSDLAIGYSLPDEGSVILSVFDLSGRRIAGLEAGSFSAGEHTSSWSPGTSLPDGCYLVVLEACGERIARRCVRL